MRLVRTAVHSLRERGWEPRFHREFIGIRVVSERGLRTGMRGPRASAREVLARVDVLKRVVPENLARR